MTTTATCVVAMIRSVNVMLEQLDHDTAIARYGGCPSDNQCFQCEQARKRRIRAVVSAAGVAVDSCNCDDTDACPVCGELRNATDRLRSDA